MGGAIIRRFALFPMMLLMLLLLPAGMVAQKAASSSKYIATYDSDAQTLTFKKYTGESLPGNSAWVKDGTLVFELNKDYLGRQDIKHIVLDESFKTFTPTSLNSFFALLFSLETIQGLEYLNTTNVTDMSGMFNHCVRLTSLDVTHFNTEKVTNMSQMFNGCACLASLDVTNFNTANVSNMEYMFCDGSNLKAIYASDKFVTNAVTKSSGMFAGCESLSGDIDWTSGNATDKTYAKLDGGYFREKGVADRPWVKYADGTLTFLYGYKRTVDVNRNEYELNSGENSPAWKAKSGNITQVVFDASFANARPTTCFKWFSSFSKLTQVKGVENLNTENVTNMGNMFAGCSSLASLDVTHFNTANVTNMNSMFYLCSSLTSLDVTHFNTEKVTDMCNMFGDCNELTSLDVTHFNTEKVTDMYNMFGDCWRLASLDVTHFNTANVTNMDFMFFDCLALTSLDVTHFNTAKVEGMSGMFAHCSSLTSLDVTHFNTEKVTNMSQMFNGCACLASLDVTNFNTANVSNMEYMFCDGSNLKAIYASDKFVTNAVTKSSGMFEGCKSLSGDIDWTSDNAADKTYAKLDGGYFCDRAYDRPWVKYADGTLTFRCGYKKTLGENEYALNSGEEEPAWVTNLHTITRVVFETSFANARPMTCYAWFKNFKNLTQIEGIENLNTENVTSMAKMFSFCQELSELDVTHFNTANVTDMGLLFDNCSGLTSLDVTHFNTANVKNMSHMFFSCSGLTSLDVTHFNTANVTDMNSMFYNSNLAELDLTHFNTANVTDMRNMFAFCQNLTTIYVNDDFVITNKSYDLFSGCTKLKGAIDYGKWKTGYNFANYKTGYFTKLVGKNGDEKIGAVGETLATENLALDDNKDFVAYEPFTAKAASYSRTMSVGTTWATLCLPFEVSLANQNFRAFKLLSADDAAETVELEEIETSIAAGTPVIIKMKDGEIKLSFTVANKEIANEVKTAETANGNYQLQGLYTQKVFSKDTDNNCYIVKGEKLMNPAKLLDKTATEFVGSKPFRAYMEDKSSVPVAGARMFSIRIGDGTTAIKQLEADAADGKAEYYDLQGHRLQDLQKGVNIVKRGGKTMKVVIK